MTLTQSRGHWRSKGQNVLRVTPFNISYTVVTKIQILFSSLNISRYYLAVELIVSKIGSDQRPDGPSHNEIDYNSLKM